MTTTSMIFKLNAELKRIIRGMVNMNKNNKKTFKRKRNEELERIITIKQQQQKKNLSINR